MSEQVQVIVAIKKSASFADVVEALRAAGLITTSNPRTFTNLAVLHCVAGSVAADKLAGLSDVAGVESVERERTLRALKEH